jgi:DNA polymerase III, alpha subunit (gram-positive type)
MRDLPTLPERFVIFDTEFTSWEGAHARNWSGEGEHRELIQLGTIKVRRLAEVDSLLLYSQPVINPQLSDFIIELTGVTQQDVDERGKAFTAVYQRFMEWVGDLPVVSFGTDETVLQENHDLQHTGVQLSIEQFSDVRDIFKAAGIETQQYSSGTIPAAFGLTPPPDAHDALNDCRSILLALQALYTTP